MLQNIRNTSKSWAWVIVLLISIPFAFWGIERFQTQEHDASVAQVGSRSVGLRAFSNAYFAQKQRMQEEFGEDYERRVDDVALRNQVLRSLVVRYLTEVAADDIGFVASDEQLARVIRSNPEFQTAESTFDIEKYRLFLQLNEFSPEQYESLLRWRQKDIQFKQALLGTNFITDREIKDFYEVSAHEREFAWALLPWQQVRDQMNFSEPEVSAVYEQNQQNFSVPEMVKVEYISLNLNDMAEKIEASDEKIRAYYDDNKESFRNEEQRSASHILFALEQQEVAQQVLQQLKEGGDFATLAKEHSIDAGSAQAGGSIGFFGRGAMVPEFEEAVFAMQEGEVSDLVQTQFGYHIIRMDSITAEQIQGFESVKEEAKRAYQRDTALAEFFEKQDQLATLSFESPNDLSIASDGVGFPVQQSDWFSFAEGNDIAEANVVREAAFSDEVRNGSNSQLLELSPEHVVVLRAQEYKPAFIRPLEEVREQIVESILREKSSKKILEMAQKSVQDLSQDKVLWEQAVSGFEVSTGNLVFDWYSIEDAATQVQQTIFRSVFDVPRVRSGDKTHYYAGASNQGDVLLFALRGSREAAKTESYEEVEANLRSALNRYQQSNDRFSILEQLQNRYDIHDIDTSKIN